MTEQLQKLIETAEERKVGDFDIFMVIPNGIYNGFWGVNGYDNLFILGYVNSEKKWYKITDYGDLFDIPRSDMKFELDIPSEYGIQRFSFGKPVHIDVRLNISRISGEIRG